jgi:acyl-CoA thioesterase
MTTRFDRDSAVTASDRPGHYEARIDEGWFIVRGPNGGYLAAILVNAMSASVGDPARGLRSLNVHYLRPPRAGRARIETRLERSGRSLATVSARLFQGDELQALATAAFSVARQGPSLHHAVMPEVPPPAELPLRERSPAVPFHALFEQRVGIGPALLQGERQREAVTGGWLRLAEPRPLDASLLVTLADAWPPAVFATSALPPLGGGVPTIDLTVHVRTTLPLIGAGDDDYALVVFRTRQVSDGFLEEDGEIWSPRGELLAQSRQLGVVM